MGFGILTMMNFQVQLNTRTGVVNSWYDEVSSTFNPTGTFAPIPSLSLEIDVNTGEHVYISYNANARITNAKTEFKICINNVGQEYAEIDSDVSGDNIKICVSMQCVNNSLVTGTYNITIWARLESGTSCGVSANTLFVQSYIP
jgi:hypothetical protein